jgi:hypothetical protein
VLHFGVAGFVQSASFVHWTHPGAVGSSVEQTKPFAQSASVKHATHRVQVGSHSVQGWFELSPSSVTMSAKHVRVLQSVFELQNSHAVIEGDARRLMACWQLAPQAEAEFVCQHVPVDPYSGW